MQMGNQARIHVSTPNADDMAFAPRHDYAM